MIKYEIAIPSYKRADILKNKTMNLSSQKPWLKNIKKME